MWKICKGIAPTFGGELCGRQVVEAIDDHFRNVGSRLMMCGSSMPPSLAESLEHLRLEGDYDIEQHPLRVRLLSQSSKESSLSLLFSVKKSEGYLQ